MIETSGNALVKGARKNFENDFTVANKHVFIVRPTAGKKLRLVEIRYSFKAGTTEDRHWVFEIAINATSSRTIVNQKYYKDYRQLIAQSNEAPQIIDGVIYMKFNFPRLDDSDYNVMELLSSMDMELKIYTTNDAEHPSGAYTPYTELTTPVGGTDPVAYIVLETVSVDE